MNTLNTHYLFLFWDDKGESPKKSEQGKKPLLHPKLPDPVTDWYYPFSTVLHLWVPEELKEFTRECVGV